MRILSSLGIKMKEILMGKKVLINMTEEEVESLSEDEKYIREVILRGNRDCDIKDLSRLCKCNGVKELMSLNKEFEEVIDNMDRECTDNNLTNKLDTIYKIVMPNVLILTLYSPDYIKADEITEKLTEFRDRFKDNGLYKHLYHEDYSKAIRRNNAALGLEY